MATTCPNLHGTSSAWSWRDLPTLFSAPFWHHYRLAPLKYEFCLNWKGSMGNRNSVDLPGRNKRTPAVPNLLWTLHSLQFTHCSRHVRFRLCLMSWLWLKSHLSLDYRTFRGCPQVHRRQGIMTLWDQLMDKLNDMHSLLINLWMTVGWMVRIFHHSHFDGFQRMKLDILSRLLLDCPYCRYHGSFWMEKCSWTWSLWSYYDDI